MTDREKDNHFSDALETFGEDWDRERQKSKSTFDSSRTLNSIPVQGQELDHFQRDPEFPRDVEDTGPRDSYNF